MTLDELKEVIEANGWTIDENINFGGGDKGWELFQYSPAGEDFSFTIVVNDNVDTAIEQIKDYANDGFDIDEHVAMWVDAARNNVSGVPDVVTLVDDARDIKEMLEDLSSAVLTAEANSHGTVVKEAKEIHQKVEDLPDMCYGVLPSTNEIIIIKKGERGYYKTNKGFENQIVGETFDERMNSAEALADSLNEQIGVTPEQRMSMELRSMNGNWEDIDEEVTENKETQIDNKKEDVINAPEKLQEEDDDSNITSEESDNEDDEDDEENNSELDDVLNEFMEKNPLYERVVSEIIEDSESYNGSKLERIKARLGDISYGLATGVVGSLVYYSDTNEFYKEYEDDIYEYIDYLVDNGLEPLQALMDKNTETDVIMQTDNVKNDIVWLVYEEISYELSNRLEELSDED